MSLIKKLKKRFQRQPTEVNPWETENQREATAEDMEKAVNEMNTPLPKLNTRVIGLMFFTILWTVGHLFPLYVMIGTPISAGILLYVIVNIMIFGHYFILLNKERIK